jgi:hypothetical protein
MHQRTSWYYITVTATIACRAERQRSVNCFATELALWGNHENAGVRSGDHNVLKAPRRGRDETVKFVELDFV